MMQTKSYSEVPQEAQIVRQPEGQTVAPQETWMSIPIGMPNCPPGLEYLTAIDQILIQQKVEWRELAGCEFKNKYKIKNSLGQNIYLAAEESNCCARQCFGKARSFEMQILDNFQNEVMHFYRPLRCGCFCFPNCMNMLEIYAPAGILIGTVEEICTFMKPLFVIKNSAGDVVLRIKGPRCTIGCRKNYNFYIHTVTGERIGKITKQWRGLAKELLTDADNFGVEFPLELDVRMKAVILGATFLIDMIYFEV